MLPHAQHRGRSLTVRKTLLELANWYGSDKGTIWFEKHNYARVYDAILGQNATRAIKLLEIGLLHPQDDRWIDLRGSPETNDGKSNYAPSLSMWRDFFPNAEIHGLDRNDFSSVVLERCVIHRGDSSSADDLARVTAYGPFDCVIDDGSHASAHQQIALGKLFPHVNPGGYYFIEDLHWQPMDLETSGLHTTRTMLANFINGRAISTSVLSSEENLYLNTWIESVWLFDSCSDMDVVAARDALAVIKKRGDCAVRPGFIRSASSEPSDRVRKVVGDVFSRIPRAIASIAPRDAMFLLSIIERRRPTKVIEVGVAAGTSSVAILSMFHDMKHEGYLYSFDLADMYYADTTKAVGFLIDADPVACTQNYKIYTGSLSADIESRAGTEVHKAEVVFIDGHHGHPWATLDTLCVMPFAARDSWIVLHDVNLPKYTGKDAEHGPRILFDYFAGEKYEDEDTHGNIGAIHVDPSNSGHIESLLDSLEVKWEFAPPRDLMERVNKTVCGFLQGVQLTRYKDIVLRSTGIRL